MSPKRKNSHIKKRWLFYTFIYLALGFTAMVIILYAALPDVGKLKGSIKIDRKIQKGDKTLTIPFLVGEKNPDFVPYSRISKNLINAVIVAEDIEFWSHNGFNMTEIKESIKKNLSNGSFVRGASTITQQLMKNIYLSGEKTFYRKLKEAILTYKAERVLTKGRILELYLNVIEWGDNIYGIRRASKYHFGKEPANLTAYESAYLASLIPSPKKYSKVQKGSRLDQLLTKRRNTILWWMEKAGYLASSAEARKEAVEKAPILKEETSKQPALGKTEAAIAPTPTPKPTLSADEDKELMNMIEEFQPEEVFKGSESFKAPADNTTPKPKE
jgi:monofunctional glycosyltransferase